ncbi:receptor-type tyrosine-protein phosphatase eta [Aplysia californica]|uniref:Receptor-type tyrosine-protein phosphatase eta n=1 Tax=Aplysia californica TaxID=6500 RepID=A0ABM1A4H0_APLCA|nr:receptor-type tyrosine-protein phosphatase eta [Aplysia californica]
MATRIILFLVLLLLISAVLPALGTNETLTSASPLNDVQGEDRSGKNTSTRPTSSDPGCDAVSKRSITQMDVKLSGRQIFTVSWAENECPSNWTDTCTIVGTESNDNSTCRNKEAGQPLKPATKYTITIKRVINDIPKKTNLIDREKCTGMNPIENATIRLTQQERLRFTWENDCKWCTFKCFLYFGEKSTETKGTQMNCEFDEFPYGAVYNLTIQGNGTGECRNASTSKQISNVTASTKPEPVTNVSAEAHGDGLKVTWSLNGKYPGPVSFSVTVKDVLTGNSQQIFCPKAKVNDNSQWKNHTGMHCIVEKLKAFWLYSAQVKAKTSEGFSISKLSKRCLTEEGVPSPVNFTATLSDKNSKVVVRFSELAPIERRQPVRFYFVNKTLDTRKGDLDYCEKEVRPFKFSQEHSKLPTVDEDDLDSVYAYLKDTELRNHSKTFDVLPGCIYKFTVTTGRDQTSGGNKAFNTQSISVPIRKPRPWNVAKDGPLVKESNSKPTKNSLTFLASSDFFKKSSSGPIASTGFVVSRIRVKAGTTNIKTLKSYSVNRDKFRVDYSAASSGMVSSGTKVFVRVSIGSNTKKDECLNSKNSQNFKCNGPLRKGTTYHVNGFACTTAGCREAHLYTGQTADEDVQEEKLKNAIIGSSVAVVLVIIIAVLVVALFYRSMKRETAEITNRSPTQFQLKPFPNLSKPIVLAEIEKVVKEMSKDSGMAFMNEFGGRIASIPIRPFYKDCVTEKNRYEDIKPYADSIVLLSEQNGDPATTYINANFIPGYNDEREYIATQAPLPNTVADMWRLIWERDISIIVMLTAIREGKTNKCEQYWPEVRGTKSQYGDIHVRNISVSSINNYNITIFSLTHDKVDGVVKEVKHFHLLTWSDHSANVPPPCLVQFAADVRSHVTPHTNKPVLVHCSAGVGRTGTFLAIDYLNQFLQERRLDEEVDILAYVTSMRKHRIFMVQVEKQYALIHECAAFMMQRRRKQEEEEGVGVGEEGMGEKKEEKTKEDEAIIINDSDNQVLVQSEVTSSDTAETRQ